MIRIATWNLNRPRPRSWRRIPLLLLEQLRAINADVWVLTETHSCIDLSDTHLAFVSKRVTPLHRAGENWTTIWSRYPARPVDTYDSTIAVCADIAAPGGPMLVYGTVLPYHADRGPSGRAPNWSEHYRVLPLQGADWRSLRDQFPLHRLCVAGDFNQSREGRPRSGGQYYGTKQGRALLTSELRSARLTCVTGGELVGAEKMSTCATIDHICLDVDSVIQVQAVRAWDVDGEVGVRLSDHNGIYLDLTTGFEVR